MKKTAHRLSSLLLVIAIVVSLVAAALAPLFAPATIAQTNPQTTDMFTGQFIPAYFGSAYDPTEAYKQMAGMPVYVFAYDTWGKVVNNFAYSTQVKADGSFQAAGLPNASHYGVCVPVTDLGVSLPDNNINASFRAPKPEDGIQSAFAYSQATFPNDAGEVRTQTGVAAKLTGFNNVNNTSNTDDDQGCRVFLTSSRQTDIANHINIFPVIPISVLSVIISDDYKGVTDIFNFNKPYEVYAQRVIVNNNDSQSGETGPDQQLTQCLSGAGAPLEREGCMDAYNEQISNYNYIADGPVIRGRTIAYNPTNEDGSLNGRGTIFQAFAPRGIYAITYWRPDSRSSNAQITYLTYDGQTPLGAIYNGVAIEEVRNPALYRPNLDSPIPNAWQAQSIRSAKWEEGATNEAWLGVPGTINLWGMVTAGGQGRVIPKAGIGLKVNEDKVGFMNIATRSCEGESTQSYESSKNGLYMVSSLCGQDTQVGRIEGTLSTTIGTLKTEATSGGDFKEQIGISVRVTGEEGAARRDISLSSVPYGAYTGQLQRDGRPFAFARVDLSVNGKLHKNVAQADSSGFFYIPNTYFNNNPYTSYKITVSPWYNAPNFANTHETTYALNTSQVLAAKNGKGADMGVVAINARQSGTVQSFLAGLSFTNLLAKFRIPTAFAQNITTDPKTGEPTDPNSYSTVNRGEGNIWTFKFDREALGPAIKYFNLSNYSLETVEINPPENGVWIAKDNSEYEFFTRAGAYDGALIEYAGDDPNIQGNSDTWLIEGVQLQEKTGTDISFGQMFTDLETNVLRFNLRVRFEYRHDSPTGSVNEVSGEQLTDKEEKVVSQNTSSGQQDGTTYPKVLEANWPIDVTAEEYATGVSPDSLQTFTVVYDPIVLEQAAPSCSGGSWKDPIGTVKSLMCKAVLAGINAMKSAINMMADNFLTIDPLNFAGADVVIKYWNAVRNLINSLAVLILLVAGVAIMLQYEPTTFNLQSVLKRLIVAVVLINFSILVIQVAIDIANVVALGGYYMLNGIFENEAGIPNARASAGALAGMLITMLGAAAASGFTGFMAFFIAVIAIILLLLYVALKIIVQYFFRMVTLWICIILAPAAFAARVLPGTSSYFGKWKNVMVGTLVAQVALALVLSLALGMIVGLKGATGSIEGMVLVLACFALLYMATKVPSKAAAMMGTDLASGLESLTKTGFTNARGALKEAAIKRYTRKMTKQSREEQLGVDKASRVKALEKYQEGLTGNGISKFLKSRKFAAQQRIGTTGAMTADATGRRARELNRVRRSGGMLNVGGLAAGVRGHDLDEAEQEAYKAADAMYLEKQYAQFPHRDAAERITQQEEMIYKQADATAQIFSRGKLTGARDNTYLTGREAGYDLNNLDVAGNVREQVVKDRAGRTILTRHQLMGDLSGDGLMHTDGVTSLQSEYAKGFNTVFRSKLDALGDEGAIARADGAVSVAKRWINDTNSRGVNTLGGDFGGFFDEFEYPPGGGVKGHKAWAAFYQDMGEDINPDVAKYPDIRGKVMEDFVFKSAGKADASWESSLRTSNNQAKSGISSRDRIDIATVPDLRLPAAPAGLPGALPRFTSMPPAGRVVTGNDLKLALDAMKDIRHTYAEVAAGQPISNERAYRNAMTRLARLGYS